MKKSKGFTLVELLVVISVIALLMAILMPALSRARELAQRIVCGNHLKTFGLANEAYSNAYDYAYVPISYDTYDKKGKLVSIHWLVNPAFRSYLATESYRDAEEWSSYDLPDEFLCPTDKISGKWWNMASGVLLSYGYNFTQWTWNAYPEYAGHKATEIKRPSEKLAFVDAIDWWVDWYGADYERGWDILGQDSIKSYRMEKSPGKELLEEKVYGPTIYRHHEGANIGFYDGHVEHRNKKEIFVREDYYATPQKPGMWVVDISAYLGASSSAP